MSTTIEIARIAAAANLLRPDWPTTSLQTFLERNHAHRPYHDLAVAVTWIATDPTTKTPARLNEAGPWWQALNTATTTRPNPEDCPRHGSGQRRQDGQLSCCWQEAHGTASTQHDTDPFPNRREVPDTARAAVAVALGHGERPPNEQQPPNYTPAEKETTQ